MTAWLVWIGRHRVVPVVLGALAAIATLVVIASLPEPAVEPERSVVYVDEEGEVLPSTDGTDTTRTTDGTTDQD